eukprot:COSAG01_NODE_4326_length_5131_cov_18.323132_4_plen_366_part_00
MALVIPLLRPALVCAAGMTRAYAGAQTITWRSSSTGASARRLLPESGAHHHHQWTPLIDEPEPTCSQTKSSSKVVGGRVAIKVQLPSPPADVDQLCCGIASPGSVSADAGNYYTVVDVGPSERYPDERIYICTAYEADPSAPNKVQIVPGNASTSAGFAPRPKLKDPHCQDKPTLEACSANYAAGHRVTTNAPPCAWWGGACHYDPPIDCSSIMTMETQPFCINIILAKRPYPAAKMSAATTGRSLRPFNWTSGTLSQGNETVAVAPTQILSEGQSSWWSLDTAYDPSWKACVQYNELSADNTTSDPNSGFLACITRTAIGVDATRGTTNKLDSWVGFGQAIPSFSTNESWWVQFVFWSNSTEYE